MAPRPLSQPQGEPDGSEMFSDPRAMQPDWATRTGQGRTARHRAREPGRADGPGPDRGECPDASGAAMPGLGEEPPARRPGGPRPGLVRSLVEGAVLPQLLARQEAGAFDPSRARRACAD